METPRRPRVTLEHWRMLQAVVDSGGYAQAAEQLNRSQSSVSYAVARLQRQLGVKLLRVEGRRSRLTPAGEVLLRRSRELIADALRIEELARILEAGWEPEVRLVVDAAFPTDLLLEAMRRFEPSSRGTRVLLRQEVLSGPVEALEDGSADLVIAYSVPTGFFGEVIYTVTFVAIAAPGHPLHRLERELTADDLVRQLQVVIRDSGIRESRDHGWLGAAQRCTVTSFETAERLIAAGIGFGWLPSHRAEPLLAEGAVRRLRLDVGHTRSNPLYLVFPQPDLAGPAARQFADTLRECAGEQGA